MMIDSFILIWLCQVLNLQLKIKLKLICMSDYPLLTYLIILPPCSTSNSARNHPAFLFILKHIRPYYFYYLKHYVPLRFCFGHCCLCMQYLLIDSLIIT